MILALMIGALIVGAGLGIIATMYFSERKMRITYKSEINKYVNQMDQLLEQYQSRFNEINQNAENLDEKINSMIMGYHERFNSLFENTKRDLNDLDIKITELKRLREKNEKLVATNRQLNERLTKKKKQLQNLREEKRDEN